MAASLKVQFLCHLKRLENARAPPPQRLWVRYSFEAASALSSTAGSTAPKAADAKGKVPLNEKVRLENEVSKCEEAGQLVLQVHSTDAEPSLIAQRVLDMADFAVHGLSKTKAFAFTASDTPMALIMSIKANVVDAKQGAEPSASQQKQKQEQQKQQPAATKKQQTSGTGSRPAKSAVVSLQTATVADNSSYVSESEKSRSLTALPSSSLKNLGKMMEQAASGEKTEASKNDNTATISSPKYMPYSTKEVSSSERERSADSSAPSSARSGKGQQQYSLSSTAPTQLEIAQQQRIAELEAKTSSLACAVKDLVEAVQLRTAQVQMLDSQLVQLRQESAGSRPSSRKSSKQRLSEDDKDKAAELTAVRQQLAAVQAQLEAEQAEQKPWRKELRERDRTLAELRSQLAEARAAEVKARSESMSMFEKATLPASGEAELRQQLEACEARAQTAEQVVAQLQSEVKQLRDERGALRRENASLKETSARKSPREDADKMQELMKGALQKRNAQIEQLVAKNKDRKARITGMRQEIKELKKQLELQRQQSGPVVVVRQSGHNAPQRADSGNALFYNKLVHDYIVNDHEAPSGPLTVQQAMESFVTTLDDLGQLKVIKGELWLGLVDAFMRGTRPGRAYWPSALRNLAKLSALRHALFTRKVGQTDPLEDGLHTVNDEELALLEKEGVHTSTQESTQQAADADAQLQRYVFLKLASCNNSIMQRTAQGFVRHALPFFRSTLKANGDSNGDEDVAHTSVSVLFDELQLECVSLELATPLRMQLFGLIIHILEVRLLRLLLEDDPQILKRKALGALDMAVKQWCMKNTTWVCLRYFQRISNIASLVRVPLERVEEGKLRSMQGSLSGPQFLRVLQALGAERAEKRLREQAGDAAAGPLLLPLERDLIPYKEITSH